MSCLGSLQAIRKKNKTELGLWAWAWYQLLGSQWFHIIGTVYLCMWFMLLHALACSVVPLMFQIVLKTGMSSHMRTVHSGRKPYKCPHCEYASAFRGNLNTHIKVSTFVFAELFTLLQFFIVWTRLQIFIVFSLWSCYETTLKTQKCSQMGRPTAYRTHYTCH